MLVFIDQARKLITSQSAVCPNGASSRSLVDLHPSTVPRQPLTMMKCQWFFSVNLIGETWVESELKPHRDK